jgi:hypothetical protein
MPSRSPETPGRDALQSALLAIVDAKIVSYLAIFAALSRSSPAGS